MLKNEMKGGRKTAVDDLAMNVCECFVWLDAQIDVTENHVKSNASSVAKLSRRFVGMAGPSCNKPGAAAVAGGRGTHRRQSSSSLTSSSSLSSTGSRHSVVSHSSNLSYSQDDVDSTGKPHDPAAANLEIHEVKVVFLKVSIVTSSSLKLLKRFRRLSVK